MPPEYLYPHWLVESGGGVATPGGLMQGYVSLENMLAWTWLQFAWQRLRAPLTMTLNDSFEDRPNPRVERHVRFIL